MRRFRPHLLCLFLVTLVAGACASGGGGPRRDQNELLPDEMATVTAINLYEAVEQLRPRWLQIRAARSFNTQTEVVVFVNRNLMGGTDVLRQFAPGNVTRLRYLDGPTAAATLPGLGTRAVEGAIVIEIAGG